MILITGDYSHMYRHTGIYIVECRENGMQYVGQSTNLGSRINEHFSKLRRGVSRNKGLQRDYDLFGEAAFDVSVRYCSSDELDDLERAEIMRARDENRCYNVFSGGRTGYKGNEAFRERARELFTGRTVTDSEREKHAQYAKEQWADPEYRDIMTNSAKSQWKDPEYRKIMRDAHLKISDDDMNKIAELRANGMSCKQLAAMYGVSASTIFSRLKKLA